MREARWPTLADLLAPDAHGQARIENSRDPWQRDYVLHPGERAAEFRALSLGPDGIEGTEDDIVWPAPD